MRRFSFCLLLVCTLCAFSAHADSIPAGTYNLTNTYVDGFQITGDVVLNGSGIVTSASLTLEDAALSNPMFTSVNSAGGPSGYSPVADYAYIAGADGQIVLYYLTTTDGTGNIDLCINGVSCNSYQASYAQIYGPSSLGYSPVDLSSGKLNAAIAATPEPSSLALMGSGILGAAGLLRRRMLPRKA